MKIFTRCYHKYHEIAPFLGNTLQHQNTETLRTAKNIRLDHLIQKWQKYFARSNKPYDLDDSYFSRIGYYAFCEALRIQKNVRKIILHDLDVQEVHKTDAVAILINSLRVHPCIYHLELAKSNLEDEEADLFSQEFKKGGLRKLVSLSLSNNDIQNEGAKRLAAAALDEDKPMLELDLSFNFLDADGIDKIQGMINTNNYIPKMNLSNNDNHWKT